MVVSKFVEKGEKMTEGTSCCGGAAQINLSKVDTSFNVTRYDNGFVVEISGRDEDGDWANSRNIVPTVDGVVALLEQYSSMPLDS